MSDDEIKYLFEPRTVAVIGASHVKGKIGYKVVENLVKGGYKGKVYPINPKGGNNFGLRYYKSVGDVGEPIDLAVITIPSKYVLDAVEDCGNAGVKFLVIITSGFAEVGNIEGERSIVEVAHRYGMRVLGPNVFGIYSAKSSMNATFGPDYVKKGNIAIVTQSGALGIAMIGKSAAENIGLSAIVSVGNKSDIQEAELLQYLATDVNTKAILMYIEGVKDGEKFIRELKNATRRKPVVIIKSGRSEMGAMAAASHTGSLATEDVIFDKIIRQFGALRAETIREAFNWCRFLSSAIPPEGENTLIVTNGGGLGVLAADACESHQVSLYKDMKRLTETFEDVVPSFGSPRNPVDLTGQATDEDYIKALNRALEADFIHSVLGLYCETALFSVDKTARMIERTYRNFVGRKPIAFSAFGGTMIKDAVNRLASLNVPVFEDVHDAVSCMGALYRYYRYRKDAEGVESPLSREELIKKIDLTAIRRVIKDALNEGRVYLTTPEVQSILDSLKIPRPRSRIARGIDEAVEAAEAIGYPVVMKIVSRDIIHKSDVGGVALGLDNKKEVIDAYQAIIRNCRKFRPESRIEGVEVSRMITGGAETIVGGRRDRTFGPIVMFGLGGIHVEVIKDVTFRHFPFSRREALRMIREIKGFPILMGVRGEGMKDISTLADVILKVGALVYNITEIKDMEINPLVVFEQSEGVIALDARIFLSDKGGAGA